MTASHSDATGRTRVLQGRRIRLLSLGNIHLDLDTYVATVDDEIVALTYLQFELLRLLVENPGRILPYQFWSLGVLARNDYGAQRHLAVLVHGLRQKIAGARPYVIRTVRGRGYGLLLAGGQEASA
jgi:DNA-binding response OmpR family regulator